MYKRNISNSGFAYWVALIVSLLSLVSKSDKPTKEMEGLTFLWQWIQYIAYDFRFIIGILAIASLVIFWLVFCRRQYSRTDAILKGLQNDITIAPSDEVQVSYFNKQKGFRVLWKYLANILFFALSWKNLKNGIWWIYATRKFPRVSKDYLVKTNQYRTMSSHHRPYLYFQVTNDENENNGFVSYSLVTPTHNKIKTNVLCAFDGTKRNLAEYPTNERKSIEAYLRKMHLTYDELRCFHTIANYIRVEPISNRESEHIGALVIDIRHSGRDLATEDPTFNEIIASYVKTLYYSENF